MSGYESIPDFVDWTQPINWGDLLNFGLVAKYLAVEGGGYGGGKWLDLCGKSNGTLTGMTTGYGWQGPNSRRGGWGAMRFDGTDDYVSVSDSPFPGGSNPFTISFWVNCNSFAVGNYGVPFSYGTATTNLGLLIAQNGNDGTGSFLVGRYLNNVLTTKTVMTAKKWHFFTVTYDGGTNLASYTDGVYSFGAFASFSITKNSGRIGSLYGGSLYFNGYVDDVSVYNRYFSATEAAGLYEASMSHYPTQLNRFAYRPRYVPSGFNPAWAARSTITLQPGCAA